MNIVLRRVCPRLDRAIGQAMPEYAVVAAAIIFAAYLTFRTVGTDVNTLMSSIKAAFGL